MLKAIISALSPTLLTPTAFSDAIQAFCRVDQKLISRKEQTPTPSQPRKNTIKLSAVTRISIKKVKSERYA